MSPQGPIFPVVFTVSNIMIRLRYIIESCQSFQTVLFFGLRNISLQILRIVGRVWNEGSRMLCQRHKNGTSPVSVNFTHDIRGSKFTLICRNTKTCSELVVLEVRVSFACPHTYTPRSNLAIIAFSNITVRFALEHFPSH